MVETLNKPNDWLVVNVGKNNFTNREVDLQVNEETDLGEAIETKKQLLLAKQYFVDYSIWSIWL